MFTKWKKTNNNSKFSFWQKNGNKSTELYYYEWYFRWIHEFQIKQFTIRNDFDDFSVFFWCTCGSKHYTSSNEKWIPWYLSKRLRFSRRVHWIIVIKCLNKNMYFTHRQRVSYLNNSVLHRQIRLQCDFKSFLDFLYGRFGNQ